jgi:hypothetical protein
MTIRLLYHDVDSPDAVSPFDAAIVSIATKEHVRLACPYLSLTYLCRIISLGRSWRLLTNVEEWLLAHNRTQRKQIYDFLARHRRVIRHYPHLHAKVVIGSRAAMVGSANFTDMGIRRRTEVSVHLEDEPQVQELTTWFDTLWAKANELPIDDIAEYMKTLPEGAEIEEVSDPVLFPPLSNKPARLVQLPGSPSESEAVEDEPAAHQRLIQRVGMAGSRSWLEGYLNLVKHLLEDLEIASSDRRLAMSIPKGGGGWFLPVSINNRYVLAPHARHGENLVGVIFGSDFERRRGMRAKVVRYGRFEALPGEDPEAVPFFLELRSPEEVMEDDEVRLGWLQAARHEATRARSSPYRGSHVPACYRLAVDLAYRQSVLDQGFSSVPAG